MDGVSVEEDSYGVGAVMDPGYAIGGVLGTRHFLVELDNHFTFMFPLSDFKKLRFASREDLNQWELIGGGTGIRWSVLDEDLSIAGLARVYIRDWSDTLSCRFPNRSDKDGAT